MRRKLLDYLVFATGLSAIIWIGAGYLSGNPLALTAITAIALCYLSGAIELWRHRRATAALQQALAGLTAPPPTLTSWLERLPAPLRNPVRLRTEGERVALPGPALTPYLVGMLVLLGMLGTLLGMMATLRGTGLALETATDLDAMRASLAAPVKGLSLAFGTSIAGVAASAMLGLLAALARREQARTSQLLDLKIATLLHPHSPRDQREQALQLLQCQADSMPLLVDRLQTLADALERQQHANLAQQLSAQERFHGRSEATHERFVAVVEQALRQGLSDGAQAHSDALRPALETTLTALAQQADTLHQHVGDAVQRQLDALQQGFATSSADAAAIWRQAQLEQQHGNQQLRNDLRQTLDGFNSSFQQHTDTLLGTVSTRLNDSIERLEQGWRQAQAQQQHANGELSETNQRLLADAATALERQSLSLLQRIEQSQQQWHTALATQDQQRQAGWSAALATVGQDLQHHWQQAAATAVSQQQTICTELQRTGDALLARSQTHAETTIREVSRLLANAAEAPKAAAEIIAELRQNLTDSIARDNVMLDQRNELVAALEHLIEGASHAADEQRAAINALVAASAEALERTGSQLARQLESEAGKLEQAAAEVQAGSIEIASVGDAFGAVVQQFGQTNQQLAERLQQLESTLAQTLQRSDEQLAYYVAQAREVVDLSVLSQRQIIEELQRIGHGRAGDAVATA